MNKKKFKVRKIEHSHVKLMKYKYVPIWRRASLHRLFLSLYSPKFHEPRPISAPIQRKITVSKKNTHIRSVSTTTTTFFRAEHSPNKNDAMLDYRT